MQGEYIAPEKVEAVYGRSALVAQAFVYGDSLKAQLVAVVVPDPDVLLPWAAERGMSQSLPELCKDAAVSAAVLRSMQQEGAAAQLKGFEQVWPCPLRLVVYITFPYSTFPLAAADCKLALQPAVGPAL
jgi:long-chain acyl-CoA synthetase